MCHIMKLNYCLSLCFLILQLSQAKESKMKNLLKEAEQIKSGNAVNKVESTNTSQDDTPLLYYGWHRGRIMSYNNFEYKGQHGWMTSKEAVKKCDIDPACGGIVFNFIVCTMQLLRCDLYQL